MIDKADICERCKFNNSDEDELGIPCDDCLDWWMPKNWLTEWFSSFNTESATTCFEAVQKLKQRVKEIEESKKEGWYEDSNS